MDANNCEIITDSSPAIISTTCKDYCKEHLDAIEITTEIEMTAKSLYECMFECEKGKVFWQRLHDLSKDTHFHWGSLGEIKRKNTFIIEVSNPMRILKLLD